LAEKGISIDGNLILRQSIGVNSRRRSFVNDLPCSLEMVQELGNLILDLNGQFKTSMIQLYGWTCKEDGIRHGHTKEELKTSFEEAKYMLVSCSAFVNYLIAKNEQSLDK